MTKRLHVLALCLLVSMVASAVTITTFTGGDPGEGLDLSGEYVYAVNIAGNAQYPPLVQGVSFTNDALTDGVTVILGGSGSLKGNWGTKPEYGDTGNDNWLEAMMQATALSYGTDPVVEVDLNVIAGGTYDLQLLFSENFYTNSRARNFNIAVEGVPILNEFTPIPAGAEWTAAPNTGMLVTYRFVAGDTNLNIVLTSGSSGDVNPVIQGITLKEIGALVSVYDQWVNGFLPVFIGFETNDYDGDLKNNFYEYVFNGDPTNQFVCGEAPVLKNMGEDLQLLHVQRADDSGLSYTLQASTNLLSGAWGAFEYDVLGTNVTGEAFDVITNSIPVAAPQAFIRLKAERN